MADGQVVFEIKGDNQIKGSLDEAKKDITSATSEWKELFSGTAADFGKDLAGALTSVAVSAAFVKITNLLKQLGAESIEIASDLEEVQNVVDVTFGEAGSARIEKWAQSVGSQFGLTELQAKRYASTMGAMLKSSGITGAEVYELSTSLAELAADMASFYNIDFDTAFQKIQSGISGQVAPLKQLGINLSVANLAEFALQEGIQGTYDDMNQAEKTMLRYQYLMAKTADAQGDFARTSDSYANSQRRITTGMETLKAQLGEMLLPIVSTVSDAIADLLEVLTYSPPETVFDKAEASMSAAAGSATEAQGILGYMDKLMEKYGDAAKNTNEWKQALEQLKMVFPEVNKYISEETGELTATNEQLRKYIENSKQAAIEDAKKAAMASLNQQYVEAGKAYYTAEINRDIAREEAASARQSLIDYIGRTNTGFTGAGMDMQQIIFAAQATANELGESQDTIKEWINIYNTQMKNAEAYDSEMASLSDTMSSLEAQINIASQALNRLASAAATASSAAGAASAGMSSGQYYSWYYSQHSHAGGLDYVPYDGYRAILHKGERVETAAEASFRRQYGLQQPTTNIASSVWENAPKFGGNVYLDGRVVGSVISDQQGKSYRQLQRSGWQG